MKPHEYSSSFASARCDDCGKSRDTRTYDTPDEPAVDVADIISWARRHAKRGHYVELNVSSGVTIVFEGQK